MYRLIVGYEHLNTGIELSGMDISFWRESPSTIAAWSHHPFKASWTTISGTTGAQRTAFMQAEHTTQDMPSTPYTQGHIREIARASMALASISVVSVLESITSGHCWCHPCYDIARGHSEACKRTTHLYREIGGIHIEGAV